MLFKAAVFVGLTSFVALLGNAKDVGSWHGFIGGYMLGVFVLAMTLHIAKE